MVNAPLNISRPILILLKMKRRNTRRLPSHEKWAVKWIEESTIPNINVGLEVNDYYPVRLDELLGKYHKAKNEREK